MSVVRNHCSGDHKYSRKKTNLGLQLGLFFKIKELLLPGLSHSSRKAVLHIEKLEHEGRDEGKDGLKKGPFVQLLQYPKLSYFTLNISKYTIRDLED